MYACVCACAQAHAEAYWFCSCTCLCTCVCTWLDICLRPYAWHRVYACACACACSPAWVCTCTSILVLFMHLLVHVRVHLTGHMLETLDQGCRLMMSILDHHRLHALGSWKVSGSNSSRDHEKCHDPDPGTVKRVQKNLPIKIKTQTFFWGPNCWLGSVSKGPLALC